MYNKHITLGFLSLSCCLLSSMALAFQDFDHLGFFGINTVVYDIQKLSPHKYTLEATTSNGVSASELLKAYKLRAARLCQGQHTTTDYKISTETYMGEFNATMSLPMTAPKINGVVTCVN